MEAVYEVIRNIAVYLILVTVLLNLANGNSYKKYVELVCGMVLILIVLSPIKGLLSLENQFQYNYDLSRFKVERMEADFIARAEETKQEKLAEEYKKVLLEKIDGIVESQGRTVRKADITLSEEDYGIMEKVIVEVEKEEADSGEESGIAPVETVHIDEIYVAGADASRSGGTEDGAGQSGGSEGEAYMDVKEKNKTTEAIRRELANTFAMKEEQIIVYEKEE